MNKTVFEGRDIRVLKDGQLWVDTSSWGGWLCGVDENCKAVQGMDHKVRVEGAQKWMLHEGRLRTVDYEREYVLPLGGAIHQIVAAPSFPGAGPSAWAIADYGQVLVFDGTDWREHPDSRRVVNEAIVNLDMTPSHGGWAITASGKILRISPESGSWAVVRPLRGTSVDGHVVDIHVDRKGDPWILYAHGLETLRGDRWQPDEGLGEMQANPRLTALAVSGDGSRGWAAGTVMMEMNSEGVWSRHPQGTELLRGASVEFLWASTDGASAFAVTSASVLVLEGSRWRELRARAPHERGSIIGYDEERRALKYLEVKDEEANFSYSRVSDGTVALAFSIAHNHDIRFVDFTTVGRRIYVASSKGLLHGRPGNWSRYGSGYSALGRKTKSAFILKGFGEKSLSTLRLAEAGPVLVHEIDCDLIGVFGLDIQLLSEHAGYSLDKGKYFDAAGCRDLTDSQQIEYASVLATPEASRNGWVVDTALYSLNEDHVRLINPAIQPTAVVTGDDSIWIAGLSETTLTRAGEEWTSSVLMAGRLGRSVNKTISFHDVAYSGGTRWLVGEEGAVLRMTGDRWKRISPQLGGDLRSVAVGAGGNGWAVGQQALVLKIEDTATSVVEVPGPLHDLHGVALDSKGTGWAVGEEGTILRHHEGAWKLLPAVNDELHSVALDDGGDGWIVGEKGLVLRILNGRVFRDGRASSIATHLDHIDLTADGRRGWAGGHEDVLQVDALEQVVRLRDIALRVTDRSGRPDGVLSLVLECPPHFKCDRLDLLSSAGSRRVLSPPRCGELYEGPVEDLEPGSEFTIEAAIFDPERAYLTFTLRSPSIELPVQPGDRQWLWLLAPALLLMQVGVAFAAIRWYWARAAITDPVWSHVVGLVFGRYLIFRTVLITLRRVRLGIFSDYRLKISAAAWLSKWEGEQSYTPMNLHAPGDGALVSHAEFMQRVSPGRVYFVVGRSGAGKSALLEQWMNIALRIGRVAFLAQLGTPGPALEEVAALSRRYGRLRFDDAMLNDLLRRGGFVLFLDAYNEDDDPVGTLKLIRETFETNVVIVTSQFVPTGWPRDMSIERYDLAELSDAALESMLSDTAVRELRARADLEVLLQDVRLPSHARLLADYYAKHGRLPSYRIELYEDLRNRLMAAAAPGGFVAQVEHISSYAWTVFSGGNRRDFKIDPERVSAELCAYAVEVGILTIAGVGGTRYRFRHETIQMFFVVQHLRADGIAWGAMDRGGFAARHLELGAMRSNKEWRDIFEFYIEWCARDAPEAVPRLIEEMHGFSPELFNGPLVDKVVRFEELNPRITLDRGVWRRIVIETSRRRN